MYSPLLPSPPVDVPSTGAPELPPVTSAIPPLPSGNGPSLSSTPLQASGTTHDTMTPPARIAVRTESSNLDTYDTVASDEHHAMPQVGI